MADTVSDPVDLDRIYVKPGPELYNQNDPYPESSFSYDTGSFPDSPYGEYSYFYDYYIYQCGIAYQMHFARIRKSGGNIMDFLKGCANGDNVASITGMGASDAHLNATMDVAQDNKFSGTALSPVRGLWHYFNGDGETMRIDIEKVFIQQPYASIVDRNSNLSIDQLAANLGPGSHHITVEFPYDTASSGVAISYLLGNITLKLDGTMSVNGDGSFTIDGEFRAFDDIYNGGPANRGAFKEWLTSFITGGKDYYIKIEGSQSVHYDSNNPFFIGPPKWQRSPSSEKKTIEGNPSTYDSVYLYFDDKAAINIVRTSATNSVVVMKDETLYLNNIKQVVVRDDIFYIEDMPIISELQGRI